MLSLILLGFGAIMLFAGWRSLTERLRLSKEGVETVATIVEIKEFVDQRGRAQYRPVWAFQDAEGVERRLPVPTTHGDSSSIRSSYTIGATRKMVYDPKAPHAGAYDAGAKSYVGLAFYLIMALGLIGFAVARMNGWVESV